MGSIPAGGTRGGCYTTNTMDPELKRMLLEIKSLSRENHRMLSAIRRNQWFSFIGKVVFWVIIIAFPLYFYQQYLRPIVSKFEATSGVSAATSSPADSLTTTEIQNLIHWFTGK